MQNEYVRFDWAIKKLLRQKTNFPVLEGFLSTLLEKKIKIEKILESESNQIDYLDKQNRVDVLAEDDKKQKYIIEVQNSDEVSYFHRLLFGTSKIITEYINKGNDYDVIPKVYSISLVFFNLGCGEDYIYHGATIIKGIHKNDILQLNDFQFQKYEVSEAGKIFPEYYILKVKDFDKYAVSPLDEWMEFLKNGVIKEDTTTPGLQEAKEILALNKMSRTEQDNYKTYMCDMTSLFNSVDYNRELGRLQGKQEGIEEGIEIGREKGIEIGREEERIKAYQEKLQSAKKMLEDNLPIEIISKYTGLSVEEITRLKSNN